MNVCNDKHELTLVKKEEGNFWGTTVAPIQSSCTWEVKKKQNFQMFKVGEDWIPKEPKNLHNGKKEKGLITWAANLIGHVREQKMLHRERTGSTTKITRIELDLTITKTTKINGYVCGQKMLRQEGTGSQKKTPK